MFAAAKININPRVENHIRKLDDFLVDRLLGGGSQQKTRIDRFRADYLPQDGCDSDEEEHLSQTMIVDDLNALRQLVADCLGECLSSVLRAEEEFATERQFFMS